MLRGRLIDAIDVPLPVLFVEAMPGAGKRTLIEHWRDGVRADGEDGAETRIVIDARRTSSDGLGYLRAVIAAVARDSGAPAPPLEGTGTEAIDSARLFLRASRRTASVAVIDADYLSAEGLEALLTLADGYLRVLLTGIDLSELIEIVRTRGVHFTRLDDRDLACTTEEARELMREAGIPAPSDHAVAVMQGCTLGHAGTIVTAVRTMPMASASGRITTDRVLAIFLAGVSEVQWPSAFTRFVVSMVRVPRFSAEEATIITGNKAAPALVYRLHLLALGRMSWHPRLRARVFTWNEAVRTLLMSFFSDDALPDDMLQRRVREAAGRCDDIELAVSALIALDELREAEDLLDDWLWDLIPNAGDSLWEPIRRRSPKDLVDHPGLLCIRLRAEPASRRTPGFAAAARRARRAMTARPERPFAAPARMLELLRNGTDHEAFSELAAHARVIAADTVRTARATPGTVSDLLLLSGIVLRSGDTRSAATFASRARRLIRIDPERNDPSGERDLFASRIELLAAREQGRDDPPGAGRSAPPLRHDADLVVGSLAAVWAALDEGDLDGARAELLTTVSSVEAAEDWAVLRPMRAWISALQGRFDEAQLIMAEQVRADTGPSATSQHPPTVLAQLIGLSIRDPERIPLPATALQDHDSPRLRHASDLLDALTAVRAGQPATARSLLERAITVLPRHRLSTVALARASAQEVGELAGLVAGHPLADRLGLESANDYHHAPAAPATSLSDRECQILLHINDGSTNEQIASAMHLSPNTVKFHRANLMRKLGAHDRRTLLETARLFRLIS